MPNSTFHRRSFFFLFTIQQQIKTVKNEDQCISTLISSSVGPQFSMTVTPSHTMLPPDIIQVPGGCTLVIVVGKSNFSGSWVVTPISRDPAHFVICISTRTSRSSLGFKYRLVKTTALLNSSLALKVSERKANKPYYSYQKL